MPSAMGSQNLSLPLPLESPTGNGNIEGSQASLQAQAYRSPSIPTALPPTPVQVLSPTFNHQLNAPQSSAMSNPSPVSGKSHAANESNGTPQNSVVTNEGHSSSASTPAPTMASKAPVPQGHLDQSPEYRALDDLISKSDGSTVRQVMRDHWRKCLSGSGYHVAFLLHAAVHQASEDSLRRAFRDFDERMVNTLKAEAIPRLTTKDLDGAVDVLLSKASDDFLDKALLRRLGTIPARRLLNSLAKAERLGYDVTDTVKETENKKGEQVIPSLQNAYTQSFPQPQKQPPTGVSTSKQSPYHKNKVTPVSVPVPSHVRRPNPKVAAPQTIKQYPPLTPVPPPPIQICQRCGRPCSSVVALEYHLTRKACYNHDDWDGLGVTSCPHCSTNFGAKSILDYHLRNQICGKRQAGIDALIMHFLKERYGAPRSDQSANSELSNPKLQEATGQQPTIQTPSQQQLVNGITPSKLSLTFIAIPDQVPAGVPAELAWYHALPKEVREPFEAAMMEADNTYRPLMIAADKLPEPGRVVELSKVKNRWNTKQSTTRKKFGISLRDGPKAPKPLVKRPLSQDLSQIERKKARPSSEPSDVQTIDPPPPKRVPMTEMGGLSASSATAEMVDPTSHLVIPQTTRPGEAAQSSDSSDESTDSDSDSDDSSSDSDVPARLP